jgi:Ca-activated chloride channel family protein
LTENLGAARDTLKAIRPGDVRPGGTDLGAALDTALDAFDELEPADGRTIVVFTDGEDHADTWEQMLPRLEEAKVIVHAVAIGDAQQGHPVPVGERRSESLRYRGETVLSKRRDAPLLALTKRTGGALLRVGLASADLGTLYETRIAPIASRRREALRVPERVERYAVFVLGAFMLGVSGSWPGFRRVPTLAFLVLMSAIGAGPAGEGALEPIEAGNADYAAGRFRASLSAFERAIALDRRSAIARYNAGAALFQLGRYQESEARYREARDLAGAGLQLKIDFALGHLAALQGRFAEAVRLYDACLESPAQGAASESVKSDASVNREYAARRRPPADETTSGGNPKQAPRQSDASEQKEKTERDPAKSTSGSNPQTPSGGGQGRPDDLRNPSRAPGQSGDASGKSPAPSPEAQLDEALRNARDAREERRLTDESTSVADQERKDW